MNLQAIASGLSSIFGNVPHDMVTLGDVFDALTKNAEGSTFSIALQSDQFWMDLDDGKTSRSVVREDEKTGQKRTYHEGQALETLQSLKGSDIRLGKEWTNFDIPLLSSDKGVWNIHTTYSADEGFQITLVVAPEKAYQYARDLGMAGEVWSGDHTDLLRFLDH